MKQKETAKAADYISAQMTTAKSHNASGFFCPPNGGTRADHNAKGYYSKGIQIGSENRRKRATADATGVSVSALAAIG
ncbi:hypothetical protein [Parasitella parasitica]|uniref:Uncharacterized protein n=1 Tax=Parasitella parasitica TaxID=35722 RepID=A0A0B7NKZ1_9FUNG|nr:hypothetical protein [Parasitella parasitica]